MTKFNYYLHNLQRYLQNEQTQNKSGLPCQTIYTVAGWGIPGYGRPPHTAYILELEHYISSQVEHLYTYSHSVFTIPLTMELFTQIWHIKSCNRHLHCTHICIFRLNKHLKHSWLIFKAGILSINE
jgi:hypothetical protein